MKNIPKIDIKTIIGYSNLFSSLSTTKTFDEFKTNKLEIRIKILKKFEKLSLLKLSKNTFSSKLGVLRIIVKVIKIESEVRLKIKLKLFLVKTPTIKRVKIDRVKKTSGNNILRLFIIFLIFHT